MAKKKKNVFKPNPMLDQHKRFMESLSENDRHHFFSRELMDPERRGKIWMDQADLGEELIDRYSWAIPDDRALRILKNFSPIVEIGCGANAYWCSCMKAAGIEVVGYDLEPKKGGKINKESQARSTFEVRFGGPEALQREDLHNHSLFLCYPDEEVYVSQHGDQEAESLGCACLENFKGEYVVHVGELYGDTLSLDQGPWGRSSSADFQVRLARDFHCLLKAELPNWLNARDTISVWKRSEPCSIFLAGEDDDEEEEELEYRYIPKEERLLMDFAAPCLAHLLEHKVPSDSSAVAEEHVEKTSIKEENHGQLKKRPSAIDEGLEEQQGKKRHKKKKNKGLLKAGNEEGSYKSPW
jgi:hypothetical protein